jgi:hypothetical protein
MNTKLSSFTGLKKKPKQIQCRWMEIPTGVLSSHCYPGPPSPKLGLFSYPENGDSRFFQMLVTVY